MVRTTAVTHPKIGRSARLRFVHLLYCPAHQHDLIALWGLLCCANFLTNRYPSPQRLTLLKVRFGVALVGHAGAGKSVLLQLLAEGSTWLRNEELQQVSCLPRAHDSSVLCPAVALMVSLASTRECDE